MTQQKPIEPRVYYFNRCREIDIEVETEDGLETRNCFLASRVKIDDDSKPIVLKCDYDTAVEQLEQRVKELEEDVEMHSDVAFDAIKDVAKYGQKCVDLEKLLDNERGFHHLTKSKVDQLEQQLTAKDAEIESLNKAIYDNYKNHPLRHEWEMALNKIKDLEQRIAGKDEEIEKLKNQMKSTMDIKFGEGERIVIDSTQKFLDLGLNGFAFRLVVESFMQRTKRNRGVDGTRNKNCRKQFEQINRLKVDG